MSYTSCDIVNSEDGVHVTIASNSLNAALIAQHLQFAFKINDDYAESGIISFNVRENDKGKLPQILAEMQSKGLINDINDHTCSIGLTNTCRM